MASESNPYAAGDKVYNGGSSAATQGAVDPMGYIDRSLENSPNPAFYSPGVAAAALQTVRDNNTPTDSAVVAPTQTPAATQASTTGSISWKMPVDYDLQVKGIQQNSDYQDLLTQITATRNAASQSRVVGLRDAQTNEVDQQRKDINNAAYRGMARSSGYVGQVDKTAQYFNNARTDIETRFMAALNNADAQQVQGKTTLDNVMESIYQEAARRLAEKITNNPDAGALDPLPADTPTDPNKPTTTTPKPTTNTPPKTTPAPKPTPKPAPKPPVKAAPKVVSYTVKKGDSLGAIAKRYGISLAALKAANKHLASRNYAIYSGTTVHIPK